jgi:large subunit ribosomal protein L28
MFNAAAHICACIAGCASTLSSERLDSGSPTRDLGKGIRPSVLEETMAATCQVTGAIPGFGHNISHSHRRTKRRFDPNIQKKTYYVPSLRRNVTLQLSAKGIKVIDARGIEAVVKDVLARGEKI